MKRLAAWLLLASLSGSAVAQDPPAATAADAPVAAALTPLHTGYAFEQPEILVRQRLFGLAHGLSLLAAACLDVAEQSGSAQEAYAAWHVRQAETISTVASDLARYYFADRAGDAVWTDISRALALKEDIREALGDVRLDEACATLPTAIRRPRYEFDKLLAASRAGAADTAPAVAAAPAPTSHPAAAAPREPRNERTQ
ncbi:MAG: hypothetical protein HZA62_11415 [Rhodocyclales bacterium]|nr:hypothetical protein [Rhodocyclales bacterium]